MMKRKGAKQVSTSEIDEKIMKLEKALKEGRISKETYQELRRKYEKEKSR